MHSASKGNTLTWMGGGAAPPKLLQIFAVKNLEMVVEMLVRYSCTHVDPVWVAMLIR